MANKQLKKLNRIIGGATLFCFLFTNTVLAAPGGISILPDHKETPSFLQVEIPKDIASIEEVFEAPPKQEPKLVLHVQNIHGNYEAQKQIKKLLEYLYQKYAFKMIFAEGAVQPLDPEYLRLFEDQERNKKVADYMAQKGELTGVELYMLGAPKDVKAIGIEDPGLYRKNYDVFKKVNSKKELTSKYLSQYESRLDRLSSLIFSNETRRILADWQKFQTGQREFLPYIRRLSQDARKIISLDLESLFAQVEWPQITRLLVIQTMEEDLKVEEAQKEKEQLILFLKEKKVSPDIITAIEKLGEKRITMTRENSEQARLEDLPRYLFERLVQEASPKGFYFHDYPAFSLWAGHLILQSELDSKLLFEEIERVFEKVLNELTVTESEKNLMELYRDQSLTQKLFAFDLTRKEWEKVFYRKEWNHPEAMISRLNKISQDTALKDKKIESETFAGQEIMAGIPETGSRKTEIEDLYESALSFYDYARQRESVFMNTIKKEMTAANTDKAVLVTGGFHTQGILEMFREDSINYSVLMPKLGQEINNANYMGTMMESRKTMFDVAGLEAVQSLQGIDVMTLQGRNKLFEVQSKLEAYAKFSGFKTLSELINAIYFLNNSKLGLDRKIELVPLKDQSGVFVKMDGDFIRRPKKLSDGKVIQERLVIPIRISTDNAAKEELVSLSDHAVLVDDSVAASEKETQGKPVPAVVMPENKNIVPPAGVSPQAVGARSEIRMIGVKAGSGNLETRAAQLYKDMISGSSALGASIGSIQLEPTLTNGNQLYGFFLDQKGNRIKRNDKDVSFRIEQDPADLGSILTFRSDGIPGLSSELVRAMLLMFVKQGYRTVQIRSVVADNEVSSGRRGSINFWQEYIDKWSKDGSPQFFVPTLSGESFSLPLNRLDINKLSQPETPASRSEMRSSETLVGPEQRALQEIRRINNEDPSKSLFGHATNREGLLGIIRDGRFGSPLNRRILQFGGIAIPVGILITSGIWALFAFNPVIFIFGVSMSLILSGLIWGTMSGNHTIARLDRAYFGQKGNYGVVFNSTVKGREENARDTSSLQTLKIHWSGIPEEQHQVYLVPASDKVKFLEDIAKFQKQTVQITKIDLLNKMIDRFDGQLPGLPGFQAGRWDLKEVGSAGVLELSFTSSEALPSAQRQGDIITLSKFFGQRDEYGNQYVVEPAFDSNGTGKIRYVVTFTPLTVKKVLTYEEYARQLNPSWESEQASRSELRSTSSESAKDILAQLRAQVKGKKSFRDADVQAIIKRVQAGSSIRDKGLLESMVKDFYEDASTRNLTRLLLTLNLTSDYDSYVLRYLSLIAKDDPDEETVILSVLKGVIEKGVSFQKFYDVSDAPEIFLMAFRLLGAIGTNSAKNILLEARRDLFFADGSALSPEKTIQEFYGRRIEEFLMPFIAVGQNKSIQFFPNILSLPFLSDFEKWGLEKVTEALRDFNARPNESNLQTLIAAGNRAEIYLREYGYILSFYDGGKDFGSNLLGAVLGPIVERDAHTNKAGRNVSVIHVKNLVSLPKAYIVGFTKNREGYSMGFSSPVVIHQEESVRAIQDRLYKTQKAVLSPSSGKVSPYDELELMAYHDTVIEAAGIEKKFYDGVAAHEFRHYKNKDETTIQSALGNLPPQLVSELIDPLASEQGMPRNEKMVFGLSATEEITAFLAEIALTGEALGALADLFKRADALLAGKSKADPYDAAALAILSELMKFMNGRHSLIPVSDFQIDVYKTDYLSLQKAAAALVKDLKNGFITPKDLADFSEELFAKQFNGKTLYVSTYRKKDIKYEIDLALRSNISILEAGLRGLSSFSANPVYAQGVRQAIQNLNSLQTLGRVSYVIGPAAEPLRKGQLVQVEGVKFIIGDIDEAQDSISVFEIPAPIGKIEPQAYYKGYRLSQFRQLSIERAVYTPRRSELRGYNWDAQISSVQNFNANYKDFISFLDKTTLGLDAVVRWKELRGQLTPEMARDIYYQYVRDASQENYRTADPVSTIMGDKTFPDLANNIIFPNTYIADFPPELIAAEFPNAELHGNAVLALHLLRELSANELTQLFSARSELRHPLEPAFARNDIVGFHLVSPIPKGLDASGVANLALQNYTLTGNDRAIIFSSLRDKIGGFLAAILFPDAPKGAVKWEVAARAKAGYFATIYFFTLSYKDEKVLVAVNIATGYGRASEVVRNDVLNQEHFVLMGRTAHHPGPVTSGRVKFNHTSEAPLSPILLGRFTTRFGEFNPISISAASEYLRDAATKNKTKLISGDLEAGLFNAVPGATEIHFSSQADGTLPVKWEVKPDGSKNFVKFDNPQEVASKMIAALVYYSELQEDGKNISALADVFPNAGDWVYSKDDTGKDKISIITMRSRKVIPVPAFIDGLIHLYALDEMKKASELVGQQEARPVYALPLPISNPAIALHGLQLGNIEIYGEARGREITRQLLEQYSASPLSEPYRQAVADFLADKLAVTTDFSAQGFTPSRSELRAGQTRRTFLQAGALAALGLAALSPEILSQEVKLDADTAKLAANLQTGIELGRNKTTGLLTNQMTPNAPPANYIKSGDVGFSLTSLAIRYAAAKTDAVRITELDMMVKALKTHKSLVENFGLKIDKDGNVGFGAAFKGDETGILPEFIELDKNSFKVDSAKTGGKVDYAAYDMMLTHERMIYLEAILKEAREKIKGKTALSNKLDEALSALKDILKNVSYRPFVDSDEKLNQKIVVDTKKKAVPEITKDLLIDNKHTEAVGFLPLIARGFLGKNDETLDEKIARGEKIWDAMKLEWELLPVSATEKVPVAIGDGKRTTWTEFYWRLFSFAADDEDLPKNLVLSGENYLRAVNYAEETAKNITRGSAPGTGKDPKTYEPFGILNSGERTYAAVPYGVFMMALGGADGAKNLKAFLAILRKANNNLATGLVDSYDPKSGKQNHGKVIYMNQVLILETLFRSLIRRNTPEIEFAQKKLRETDKKHPIPAKFLPAPAAADKDLLDPLLKESAKEGKTGRLGSDKNDPVIDKENKNISVKYFVDEKNPLGGAWFSLPEINIEAGHKTLEIKVAEGGKLPAEFEIEFKDEKDALVGVSAKTTGALKAGQTIKINIEDIAAAAKGKKISRLFFVFKKEGEGSFKIESIKLTSSRSELRAAAVSEERGVNEFINDSEFDTWVTANQLEDLFVDNAAVLDRYRTLARSGHLAAVRVLDEVSGETTGLIFLERSNANEYSIVDLLSDPDDPDVQRKLGSSLESYLLGKAGSWVLSRIVDTPIFKLNGTSIDSTEEGPVKEIPNFIRLRVENGFIGDLNRILPGYAQINDRESGRHEVMVPADPLTSYRTQLRKYVDALEQMRLPGSEPSEIETIFRDALEALSPENISQVVRSDSPSYMNDLGFYITQHLYDPLGLPNVSREINAARADRSYQLFFKLASLSSLLRVSNDPVIAQSKTDLYMSKFILLNKFRTAAIATGIDADNIIIRQIDNQLDAMRAGKTSWTWDETEYPFYDLLFHEIGNFKNSGQTLDWVTKIIGNGIFKQTSARGQLGVWFASDELTSGLTQKPYAFEVRLPETPEARKAMPGPKGESRSSWVFVAGKDVDLSNVPGAQLNVIAPSAQALNELAASSFGITDDRTGGKAVAEIVKAANGRVLGLRMSSGKEIPFILLSEYQAGLKYLPGPLSIADLSKFTASLSSRRSEMRAEDSDRTEHLEGTEAERSINTFAPAGDKLLVNEVTAEIIKLRGSQFTIQQLIEAVRFLYKNPDRITRKLNFREKIINRKWGETLDAVRPLLLKIKDRKDLLLSVSVSVRAVKTEEDAVQVLNAVSARFEQLEGMKLDLETAPTDQLEKIQSELPGLREKAMSFWVTVESSERTLELREKAVELAKKIDAYSLWLKELPEKRALRAKARAISKLRAEKYSVQVNKVLEKINSLSVTSLKTQFQKGLSSYYEGPQGRMDATARQDKRAFEALITGALGDEWETLKQGGPDSEFLEVLIYEFFGAPGLKKPARSELRAVELALGANENEILINDKPVKLDVRAGNTSLALNLALKDSGVVTAGIESENPRIRFFTGHQTAVIADSYNAQQIADALKLSMDSLLGKNFEAKIEGGLQGVAIVGGVRASRQLPKPLARSLNLSLAGFSETADKAIGASVIETEAGQKTGVAYGGSYFDLSEIQNREKLIETLEEVLKAAGAPVTRRSEMRSSAESLQQSLGQMLEALKFLSGNLRLDNPYGIQDLNAGLRQANGQISQAENALREISNVLARNDRQALIAALGVNAANLVYQAVLAVSELQDRYDSPMMLKWPGRFIPDYEDFIDFSARFSADMAEYLKRIPAVTSAPATTAAPQAAKQPATKMRVKFPNKANYAQLIELIPKLIDPLFESGALSDANVDRFSLQHILSFAIENAVFIGQDANLDAAMIFLVDWSNPDSVVITIENESRLSLPDVLQNNGQTFTGKSQVISVPKGQRNHVTSARGAGVPNILYGLQNLMKQPGSQEASVQWAQESQATGNFKVTFTMKIPARSELRTSTAPFPLLTAADRKYLEINNEKMMDVFRSWPGFRGRKDTSAGVYAPSLTREVLPIFKEIIKPDDVFVDLGSGIGHILGLASHVGAKEAVGAELEDSLFRESSELLDGISLAVNLSKAVDGNFAAETKFNRASIKVVKQDFMAGDLSTMNGVISLDAQRRVYYYYVAGSSIMDNPATKAQFLSKLSKLPKGSVVILYSLGRGRDFSAVELKKYLGDPTRKTIQDEDGFHTEVYEIDRAKLSPVSSSTVKTAAENLLKIAKFQNIFKQNEKQQGIASIARAMEALLQDPEFKFDAASVDRVLRTSGANRTKIPVGKSLQDTADTWNTLFARSELRNVGRPEMEAMLKEESLDKFKAYVEELKTKKDQINFLTTLARITNESVFNRNKSLVEPFIQEALAKKLADILNSTQIFKLFVDSTVDNRLSAVKASLVTLSGNSAFQGIPERLSDDVVDRLFNALKAGGKKKDKLARFWDLQTYDAQERYEAIDAFEQFMMGEKKIRAVLEVPSALSSLHQFIREGIQAGWEDADDLAHILSELNGFAAANSLDTLDTQQIAEYLTDLFSDNKVNQSAALSFFDFTKISKEWRARFTARVITLAETSGDLEIQQKASFFLLAHSPLAGEKKLEELHKKLEVTTLTDESFLDKAITILGLDGKYRNLIRLSFFMSKLPVRMFEISRLTKIEKGVDNADVLGLIRLIEETSGQDVSFEDARQRIVKLVEDYRRSELRITNIDAFNSAPGNTVFKVLNVSTNQKGQLSGEFKVLGHDALPVDDIREVRFLNKEQTQIPRFAGKGIPAMVVTSDDVTGKEIIYLVFADGEFEALTPKEISKLEIPALLPNEERVTKVVSVKDLDPARKAKAIDQILEIMADFQQGDEGQIPRTREEVAGYIAADKLGLNQIVTDERGVVLGYLLASIPADDPTIVFIENQGVRKRIRRGGLSSGMLGELGKNASVPEINEIQLGVRDDNMPAQILYKKLGFVETGQTIPGQGYFMKIEPADLAINAFLKTAASPPVAELGPLAAIGPDKLYINKLNPMIDEINFINNLRLIHAHLLEIGNDSFELVSKVLGIPVPEGMTAEDVKGVAGYKYKGWYETLLKYAFNLNNRKQLSLADLYFNIGAFFSRNYTQGNPALPFFMAAYWKNPQDQEAAQAVWSLAGHTPDYIIARPDEADNKKALSVIFDKAEYVVSAEVSKKVFVGVDANNAKKVDAVLQSALPKLGGNPLGAKIALELEDKSSRNGGIQSVRWTLRGTNLIQFKVDNFGLSGLGVNTFLSISTDGKTIQLYLDGVIYNVNEDGNVSPARSELRAPVRSEVRLAQPKIGEGKRQTAFVAEGETSVPIGMDWFKKLMDPKTEWPSDTTPPQIVAALAGLLLLSNTAYAGETAAFISDVKNLGRVALASSIPEPVRKVNELKQSYPVLKVDDIPVAVMEVTDEKIENIDLKGLALNNVLNPSANITVLIIAGPDVSRTQVSAQQKQVDEQLKAIRALISASGPVGSRFRVQIVHSSNVSGAIQQASRQLYQKMKNYASSKEIKGNAWDKLKGVTMETFMRDYFVQLYAGNNLDGVINDFSRSEARTLALAYESGAADARDLHSAAMNFTVGVKGQDFNQRTDGLLKKNGNRFDFNLSQLRVWSERLKQAFTALLSVAKSA